MSKCICSKFIQRQNDDKVVKEFYSSYWNVPDNERVTTGLPDKFTIECVKKYLRDNGNYTIVSLTNSFVATASTNTRNATFKIVHSDLLNITSNVHQQYDNDNNLDNDMGYHTVQCSKITTVYQ